MASIRASYAQVTQESAELTDQLRQTSANYLEQLQSKQILETQLLEAQKKYQEVNAKLEDTLQKWLDSESIFSL